MNYGVYLAASGMLTSMHQLDVAANNLANVNTTAFKPDFAAIMHRQAERAEDNLQSVDSNALLDQLGGGALSAPTRTSFAPAAVEITDNPLDVAILSEGFFVLDTKGSPSGDEVQFTRDGRFTLNPQGQLVSATTGAAVLDDADRPIVIDPETPVSISPSGEVTQNGRKVATLQIVSVPDLNSLSKVGNNVYRAEPGVVESRFAISPRLKSGALEESGVDPIKALREVTDAGGDVRNNTRLLAMIDRLMDSAINTFGRVA